MFDQGKLQLSCAPLRLTQSLKNVKTDRAPYSKVSQQIERFPISLKLNQRNQGRQEIFFINFEI